MNATELERARAALARHAERLRILHEIDRSLIAEEPPVAIAEAVIRPLRDLLGVPRAIVNLFDMAAGEVEWLVAAGRRRVHRGPGVRYPLSFAGDVEALRRREPQVIDVQTLPPGPEADALLASGVRVYMVVPMIAGGELLGSISFGGESAVFPPEQVNIAQEVATQLAIVMMQARLHEQVRRQAAELELRVEERTRELRIANEGADRASRAKSEFLSRMSHELRTPLNGILGFAQLLEMDALGSEQTDSVRQILRAGRHLLALINEVLDLSGIEAGRLPLSLEPVPVGDPLHQASALVKPAADRGRVTVRIDGIDPRLHVRADRQRLQQVFLNLLSNAVKYNREGGSVTVSSEVAGSRVRIHVADTGPGIAGDKIARLFTPFDRLGAEASGVEGTGLGLAVSKHLAEAMGGALSVQSSVGVGSTFSVELPAAGEPVAIGEAALDVRDHDAVNGASPFQVLYIEDNVSNLRLVQRILGRRPGTTLLSATHGRVGVDLAREHRPGLVLLDRHLPDILGDEVLQLLRDDARTSGIPVVILSADASPGIGRRLLDAGARAYLTKPLDVRRLLALVDEVTEGAERPG